MAKPTDDPVWNTDATNRTTPDPPDQAAGWTLNQTPPSSWFNWWMFYVWAWIEWLRDFVVPAKWHALSPTAELLDGFSYHINGYFVSGGAPATPNVRFGFDLPDGTVIDKLRCRVLGDGVHTAQLTFSKIDGVGGSLMNEVLSLGVPAASWAVTEFTLSAPHTVDWTTGMYQLIFLVNGAGVGIQHAGYRTAAPT